MSLACNLIQEPLAEDKFAGIVYIQKYLLNSVPPETILKKSDVLFKNNHFKEWSTTDWFCVRVLDPLLMKTNISFAKNIAKWSRSKNFWQRRASIISFRHRSNERTYHVMIEKIISELVKEQERFYTNRNWLASV